VRIAGGDSLLVLMQVGKCVVSEFLMEKCRISQFKNRQVFKSEFRGFTANIDISLNITLFNIFLATLH